MGQDLLSPDGAVARAGTMIFSRDPYRQLALNDARRNAISDRARRENSIGELAQMLTPPLPPQDLSVGATPRGSVMASLAQSRQSPDSRMIGLLADIAPEPVVSGLLDQMFPSARSDRIPTDARMMQMLGLPLTQENYVKFKSIGQPGLDPLQQTQLQRNWLEIQKLIGEQKKTETETTQTAAQKRVSANRGIEALTEIASLNDALGGTFMQPGLSMPDLRRAGASAYLTASEWLGLPQDELAQNITNYDEMGKLLNDVIIQNQSRFGSNFTNNMLSLLQSASANPAIMPGAIDSILGQMSQKIIDDAEIGGYALDDLDAAKALVSRKKNARARTPREPIIDGPKLGKDAKAMIEGAADAAGSAVTGAIDWTKRNANAIGRMTLDQVQSVDLAQLKQFTQEQRAAYQKRMDELGL